MTTFNHMQLPSSSPSNSRRIDQQLVALLDAPFSSSPRAANRDVAWDALLSRARYHGLTPLLFARLQMPGAPDVPAPVLESLTETYRSSALAGAAKYYELAALGPLFAAAQIPFVVLKGAALAKWLYPEPARRPFGDLDLLFHAADVARLRAALAERAYQPGGELADGFGDAYYSEQSFHQTAPPRSTVVVHWHLFVPTYFRARMDVGWFWAHTQTVAFDGQPVLIFDPTAQLLHLTVHASLNHQHTPRLLWLYDLGLLMTRFAADIDWDAAAAFARASRVTRSVREILLQTEQWWGVSAPSSFMETLRTTRIGWDERAAFALTAAQHNQARALSDALATPGLANKLRYALRHVFPAPAYMTQHYHVRRRALLPFYYARRVVEIARKFARSLAAALTR